MHNSVNTIKAIELYILNGRIVWYVNYISIKLLLDKTYDANDFHAQ